MWNTLTQSKLLQFLFPNQIQLRHATLQKVPHFHRKICPWQGKDEIKIVFDVTPSAKMFKDVEVTTKPDFRLGPSLELTWGKYYWSN